MPNRITTFMGAGSAIEIGGPTTYTITENVKKIEINDENDFKRYFIKEVANKLETYYNQQEVNFEEIFHTIERLNSYMYAWRPNGLYGWTGNKETAKLYKPSLGAFLVPTQETDRFFTNDFIGITIGRIIFEVSNLIAKYDTIFDTKKKEYLWYTEFWKKLNKIALLDLATLNYDTCIERVIGGNDGFELTSNFNPKILETKEKNRILHLHGCINYAHQIHSNQYQELIKCTDYKTAENLNSRYIKQYSINQNREFSVMGPLLIGLNKTEKIQTIPYIFYNAEFIKSIVHNNSLLIIGYSFGDKYLNELLSNFINIHRENKKLVIITKMPEDVRNNPIKYIETEYGELIRFINTYVFGNIEVPPDTKYSPITETPDRSSIIYMDGFKDVATNHCDKIIDFLES